MVVAVREWSDALYKGTVTDKAGRAGRTDMVGTRGTEDTVVKT
jgi:hypothetical protein